MFDLAPFQIFFVTCIPDIWLAALSRVPSRLVWLLSKSALSRVHLPDVWFGCFVKCTPMFDLASMPNLLCHMYPDIWFGSIPNLLCHMYPLMLGLAQG
jgi:hypothetical protein